MPTCGVLHPPRPASGESLRRDGACRSGRAHLRRRVPGPEGRQLQQADQAAAGEDSHGEQVPDVRDLRGPLPRLLLPRRPGHPGHVRYLTPRRRMDLRADHRAPPGVQPPRRARHRQIRPRGILRGRALDARVSPQHARPVSEFGYLKDFPEILHRIIHGGVSTRTPGKKARLVASGGFVTRFRDRWLARRTRKRQSEVIRKGERKARIAAANARDQKISADASVERRKRRADAAARAVDRYARDCT
jgi:hypothetical protein